jgi:hypothetical protein
MFIVSNISRSLLVKSIKTVRATVGEVFSRVTVQHKLDKTGGSQAGVGGPAALQTLKSRTL